MKDNRILILNDDEAISRYLNEELSVNKGYSVALESTAEKGLKRLKEDGFELVITKFGLSDASGPALIKGLKKSDPDCIIIVLLDEPRPDLLREVSESGVYDIVAKPINLEKLFFLVKKGIDLRALNAVHRRLSYTLQEQNISLQKQNTLLAKRIEESTKNLTRLYESLRSTYMRTIKVLAQAIDARDHYTHSHSENVAKYAVAIAEEMHFSAKDIEMLREACELHDLGKIGIQDDILSKPSSLTAEEWLEIKRHPLIGAQILEPLTFLDGVIDLVKQHHENYDGSGYPEGYRGDDILLGARIIHLADAYEAMRSARSYRKIPLSKEDATLEIKKNSGTQFDPRVVEAFLRVVDRL